MTLQETLGAGAVLMTMGAGFAVAQNQLDIRASKAHRPGVGRGGCWHPGALGKKGYDAAANEFVDK